jgi:glycerol-3-phosphate dehydrogenase (NAD(P)+)
MNYGVLGAGRLGTALANFLGEREEVYLWGRDEALMKRIQFDRQNEVYLPGVELPYEVRSTYDLEHVLEDCEVLVSAVPSWAFQELLERCMGHLTDVEAFIVGTTGFDPASGRRLSQEYLERVESLDNYYVLTGPASPPELAEQQPGNLVLAGQNEHNRERLSEIFQRNYLRVYDSPDLTGHEILGALNNLQALLGGLLDGLELDSGTRASLLTRALHESRRLLAEEGGDPDSIQGLAGVGASIALGFNPESRNFRLGRSLAGGESLEQARSTIRGCLESPEIARVVHRRILKKEIKAPLFTELYGIVHENLDPLSFVEKIIRLKHPPEGG